MAIYREAGFLLVNKQKRRKGESDAGIDLEKVKP